MASNTKKICSDFTNLIAATIENVTIIKAPIFPIKSKFCFLLFSTLHSWLTFIASTSFYRSVRGCVSCDCLRDGSNCKTKEQYLKELFHRISLCYGTIANEIFYFCCGNLWLIHCQKMICIFNGFEIETETYGITFL